MDFLEAKAIADELQSEVDTKGGALKRFPRLADGRVPDSVRNTPEYRAAKTDYDYAFARLREFNGVYTAQFAREIRSFRDQQREIRLAGQSSEVGFNTVDVTESLLNDYGAGFGELSSMMKRAAPAKVVEGGLAETLAIMQDPRFDPTMGWLSAPLLYSKIFAGRPKVFHRNMIRLIKGDFLRVWRRHGVPPEGSRAATETPGKRDWYEIVMNSEKF